MLRCEDDDELLRELLRSIDTTAVDCCCAERLETVLSNCPRCENLKIVVTRRAEDAAAQNEGRKAKDHGVDRTPYQGDRKISYVSYHTCAISMGITSPRPEFLHVLFSDWVPRGFIQVCGKFVWVPSARRINSF